eukprot:2910387-Heterocapsa_arctica.AAC.1
MGLRGHRGLFPFVFPMDIRFFHVAVLLRVLVVFSFSDFGGKLEAEDPSCSLVSFWALVR